MPTSRVLHALASLKLTVALFAMAMVLIFAGTLAQATQGVWTVVDTFFRSPLAWVDLQLFIPRSLARVPGGFPFPGGLLIAGLMVVNLVAAHIVRFKANRKRAGILILHAGVIVLLLGEFATTLLADEGLMQIDEGGASSYVEDIREAELAIIDSSAPDVDQVVVVPQKLLEQAAETGSQVQSELLPVTIRVLEWLPNASLRSGASGHPGAAGVATRVTAAAVPRVRGADGGDVDAPGAYIELSRGDQTLGTWLVCVNISQVQRVAVPGGDPVDISLRFRRTYKPYTLHLMDFRHDRFVGTEVARNFSSRVRVVDPSRGTDREVVISMNEPLRYAGDTFYQASFKPDDSGTVLQVVRNPGWIIPYVACVMVGGGLLLHFLMKLSGFLRRQATGHEAAAAHGPSTRPLRSRVLPWAAAILGVAVALSGLLRPTPQTEFDIERFARLPASSGGRVKPMDTVARNALMTAGGRQSVRGPLGGVSGVEFLLGLIARPQDVKDLKVVRVDHPGVLALLGRGPEDVGRASLAEIEPHWAAIAEQADRAAEVTPKQRDHFQRAVLALHQGVNELLALSSLQTPYSIPPLNADQEWRPFHDAFLQARAHGSADGSSDPAVAMTIAMMTAYHDQDAAGFNRAVASYSSLIAEALPHEAHRASLEVWFNRAAPFYGATIVYLLAVITLCAALLRRSSGRPNAGEGLRRAGVALIAAALLVHTLGLIARIYLQGRPPVTNLYSSAVFVGWAAVALGLFLERLFPIALAALSAAGIGLCTLIIAHNLGNDGDTMQMMQAVLDTNFWLATHVITVTLGYSATFFAGLLASIYLLTHATTAWMTPARAAAMTKMVYGVVCFAMLLSFIGTVLGGIWADQSWGRFWGWDPKENGAVLVVLMNALILHARWAGMIRERGMMVLAVGGNIVTAWSWFGTNMLGVGLHSYGFIDSAVLWLMVFVLLNLGLMGLGLIGRRPLRVDVEAT